MHKHWHPSITFTTALNDAHEWLINIEAALNFDRHLQDNPATSCAIVSGYEFVRLMSLADLIAEAVAMENCVRSYSRQVARNRVQLWSVRQNAKRVATLELGCLEGAPWLGIRQLKGPRNERVAAGIWNAARDLAYSSSVTIESATEDCTSHSPVAIWQELWRPYWLAKRQIPAWLSLAAPTFTIWDI